MKYTKNISNLLKRFRNSRTERRGYAYGFNNLNLKENAKYLLSGYNTMSDEERKKFDIENYLVFFKAFFKKQSVYSLLVFPVFHLMFDDEKAILIWSLYITIAIVYLYIKSKKFYY